MVFSTDIRIAAEKEKAERIEEERQKSMKNVKDLESVKLRYEDKITKLEGLKNFMKKFNFLSFFFKKVNI